MTKTLLAVVVLAACTNGQTSTPLARLGTTQLEVVSEGELTIQLHVDTARTADCPMLSEDARATFDGMPMRIARGGFATNATGCYPIAFTFENDPSAQLVAYEATTSHSALEVFDSSARWEVDAHPLFSNNFVVDEASSKIVWQDVEQITSVQVAPAVKTTIVGNTILYPAGTHIDWVSAYAHPTPTVCNGPSVCTVDLLGSRDLTLRP